MAKNREAAWQILEFMIRGIAMTGLKGWWRTGGGI
jgi:hypothetical protein